MMTFTADFWPRLCPSDNTDNSRSADELGACLLLPTVLRSCLTRPKAVTILDGIYNEQRFR